MNRHITRRLSGFGPNDDQGRQNFIRLSIEYLMLLRRCREIGISEAFKEKKNEIVLELPHELKVKMDQILKPAKNAGFG